MPVWEYVVTSIVVIGKSHTACIEAAALRTADPSVKVINLHREDDVCPAELAKEHGTDRPLLLALSFQGNTHNILCLSEHPQKMTIGGVQVDEEERASIPHSVFHDVLKLNIEGRMVKFLEEYKTTFAGASLVVILPPPPLAKVGRERGNSKVLAEVLKQGVMPMQIRRTAYECQTELYREISANQGIMCLEPPSQALDEDGMLGHQYGSNDPTHANEVYGALVLAQLKELTHAAVE